MLTNLTELQICFQNSAFEFLNEANDGSHSNNSPKIELDRNRPRGTSDEFKNQTDIQYAVDDVPP